MRGRDCMYHSRYDERKEKVNQLLHDETYKPLKFKELCYLLQVSQEDKKELQQILDELIAEGSIMLSKKGKYQSLTAGMLVGVYDGTQKGYGFVSVDGMSDDIFISDEDSLGALHKDTVMIRITNEPVGKRKEGEVVSILQHGITELIGTFQKSKNYGFVIPDNTKYNKDIFIPKEFTKQAVSGHKVVVKLTDYGNTKKKPEGRIIEILGHINDPGTDIISIVRAYDLPTDFPEDVMRQVDHIPSEIATTDYSNRRDLTDWMTVTIDGEDAKDLDDAITLTKDESGYTLGVHIADVSHYVPEHSPLDKEALKRGTSVYLVDRVIPMLPQALSNGICSLNQGVPRLALSCIMKINLEGKVYDHEIVETVICVDQRMSYTDVAAIIENHDKETCDNYAPFVSLFELMGELSALLRKNRFKRGAIDFDFPESKIILDENGVPLEIKPYPRNDATNVIEDFMLMANETIAEDFFWQEIPFLYRIHEAPDAEKLHKLSTFLHNFGYYFKYGHDTVHPKEIQKLLNKIGGSNEEALISRLILRSMQQAKYSVECAGHFGLSTKYYCHFTSPIRRYPDLQIHRIIKESLCHKLNDTRISHYDRILTDVAVSTSKCERRAEEAEREVEKLKKVQYMAKHIGEEFDGVISGVTAWGLYVELPNTVEGMVHVTNLPNDYFIYDEKQYEMVGRDTGKTYKLGQQVRIVVVDTDRVTRTIDFGIITEEDPSWQSKEEPN